MDEELALLATIIDNREDDTPRLIYCDWLEENSRAVDCRRCKGIGLEPNPKHTTDVRFAYADRPCSLCRGSKVNLDRPQRAAFIRESIATFEHVKRWGPNMLWNQYSLLIPMWVPQWMLHLPGWQWDHRGFIGKASCRLDQLLKGGRELFTRHPVEPTVDMVNDRNPEISGTFSRGQGFRFWRKIGTPVPHITDIPADVFDHLEGFFERDDYLVYYRNETEAKIALARAVISHCRSEPKPE